MTHVFFKNFLVLLGNNLLTPLFSILLVVVISRLHGPAELGKYSLLMSVFILGQSSASLGFQILITRETAITRELSGEYFRNACLVSLLFLGGALTIIMPIVWAGVADTELRIGLELVLLALLPSVLYLYADAVLLGLERPEHFVLVSLAENIARLGLSIVLVVHGSGMIAIAMAILIFRFMASSFLLVVLRKNKVDVSFSFSSAFCRKFIRQIPVLGLIPVVNSIYTRIDIFLLTMLRGLTDVGLYSAATRLTDTARILPMAYSKAIYPIICRLQREDKSESAETIIDASRRLLVIVFCLSLILFVMADYIIGLLYGPAFSGAGLILRILTWTIIPFSMSSLLAQILFAADLQVLDLRVNLISSVVILVLNLLLIPKWGPIGSCLAALVTTTIYAILQYFYSTTHARTPSLRIIVTKVGSAAGLGLVSIALLLSLGWNPFIVGSQGLLIYAAILIFNGGITRQEITSTYLFLASLFQPR